jgi:phospholipid/cholesterol/gamma-HCH transport system substrate-binding protein
MNLFRESVRQAVTATPLSRSGVRRAAAAICVLAVLLAAGWYSFLRGDNPVTLSAEFAYADSVFPGSRVDILGVPVGRVTAVQPMGAMVKVTMSLPAGTRIPASAQAYLMSPSLISDRYVELDPAYTGGPALANGAVIGPKRTHAPIRWNQLEADLSTLLSALGSAQGLPGLVHSAATDFGGSGSQLHAAISGVTEASGMLAGDSGDITAVLANLDKLVTVLDQHRSTIDDLATELSQADSLFSSEHDQLAGTLGQLSTLLTLVDQLLQQHGGDLTGSLSNLASLSGTIAAHQRDLATTLTQLPLDLDNFASAVTPDHRLRIRMDLSTNLSQFSTTEAICKRFPLPLCSGTGIVNPVPIPPDLSGPFAGGGQ